MSEKERERMPRRLGRFSAGICFLLCFALVCGVMGPGVWAGQETEVKENQEGGAQREGPEITAKGAVLLDAASGRVLFEKNAHEPLPPASVTKVMSMLLVMEAVDRGEISLQDPVTISERAARMGGSQLFMEPGEVHRVEELMKGVAMASANDACVALAEYVGGSEEAFVEMMNERARELGMENTHFQNTNGLPVAEHYASAYDIGVMSRELLTHEALRPWLVTWMDTMTIGKEGHETEFGLTNTNRLIRQYSGATGIKTGYTADAMYCLSGSAKREDMELIGVILGASSSNTRFAEMAALLDFGFAEYKNMIFGQAHQSLGTVQVEKGEKEQVDAVLEKPAAFLAKRSEVSLVSHEIRLEQSVGAPVKKRQKLGELAVLRDGKKEAAFDLVAAEAVEKTGPVGLMAELLWAAFR